MNAGPLPTFESFLANRADEAKWRVTDGLDKLPKGDVDRCTNTCLFFITGKNRPEKLMYVGDLVEALKEEGYKVFNCYNDLADKPLKQFLDCEPKGTYLIFTKGHVMALIDGLLVDSAMEGTRRRINYILEVVKKDESFKAPTFSYDSGFDK